MHFYVKIGKLVTVTGYLVVTSVGSPVGAVSIGMPFTHENVGTNQSSIQMSWNGVASGAVNDAWGIMSPNTNYINVYVGTGSGAQTTFAQRVQAGTDLRICAIFMAS